MKRVLTFLAIMLLPLSVWAMTPVSDSDLSNVTGQAGVNINADLTMNIGIGTMAWGDQTGIDGGFAAYGWTPSAAGNGGYVGVTQFNLTGLRIKARETDTYGTGYQMNGTNRVYTGASTATLTYSTTMLKPITIDVATGDKSASGGTATTTFVRFGLGSLQITMDAMSFNVALGQTTAAINQVMGTANIGALELYINPTSYVDIFAHAGTGVSMDMNVVVDKMVLPYVSWGDTDGHADLPGEAGGVTAWFEGDGAGYIGLENLNIGAPIIVRGTVAIDVVTSVGTTAIYNHGGLIPSVTVCHISFPRLFTVSCGEITANVKLADVAALDGSGAGTLGDIYISGFNLGIVGGSWVDIWAH